MQPDVAAAAKAGGLDRLKVAQLKAYLKENHLPCTGEKEVLAWRVRSFLDGEDHHVDGANPWRLKLSGLRQVVARKGLNPIGTQDELLERLIPHLKENRPPPTNTAATPKVAATSTSSGGSSSGSSLSMDSLDSPHTAIQVAKEVIRLAEGAKYVEILRLLGDDVSASSPVGPLRKAYLKLSLMIHPDKLSRDYPAATTAFQALVHAFESLTRPSVEEPRRSSAKEKAVKTVARSNDGCFRTHVLCPRCKVEWGQNIEGNPPYFYTFMMTAAKTFVCSTCLLEFGCMSAIHLCPHCRKPFEYSPSDYHRKIMCGNRGCSSEFGFWLYFVPENVLDALRVEVKRSLERKLKEDETKRRRAAAALRRLGTQTPEEHAKTQEKLFIAAARRVPTLRGIL
eukprot:RCo037515